MRRRLGLASALLSSAAAAFAQQDTGPSLTDRATVPYRLSTNPLVAEGDRMYMRRQEGRNGAQASAGPINRAIASYEQATKDPDFVEARWKLVRALYFKGAYTGLDEDSRKAVFQKARRYAEEGILALNRSLEQKGLRGIIELGPEVLAGKLKDRTDAAPMYYWAAVAWGQWALSMGKEEAARTGAADTVRDYALTVIGIDPQFEQGGGYRVLGRLHDQAPWIPAITSWVSRDEALKALRLAVQTDPVYFLNRHFLAEALHRGDAKERAEAVAIEEKLVGEAPSPIHLVEDLQAQEDARKNLAAWKKAG